MDGGDESVTIMDTLIELSAVVCERMYTLRNILHGIQVCHKWRWVASLFLFSIKNESALISLY